MEQQKGKRVMPDPEGGRRRKSGRPPRVLVGVLIFLLLLCAGYAGMCAYAATSGKLLPNTRISGIQVGSLTREQAEAKLEAELPAKLSALSADFTCNGTAFTVSGDTLSADISGAVDAAWADNRSGGAAAGGFRFLSRSSGAFGRGGGPALVLPDACLHCPGGRAHLQPHGGDQLDRDGGHSRILPRAPPGRPSTWRPWRSSSCGNFRPF